jgi:hypothetical protein
MFTRPQRKPVLPVSKESIKTKRIEVSDSIANNTFEALPNLIEWKNQVLNEIDTLSSKLYSQYIQHKRQNKQEDQKKGELALKNLTILETLPLKTINEYRTEISRIRVSIGLDPLPTADSTPSSTKIADPNKPVNISNLPFCTVCSIRIMGPPLIYKCKIPKCNKTYLLCNSCDKKISHNKCPERSGCTLA